MENVLVVNQFIVGFVVNNTGLYKKNENINFVITCMYFFFFFDRLRWNDPLHLKNNEKNSYPFCARLIYG